MVRVKVYCRNISNLLMVVVLQGLGDAVQDW